MRKSPAPRNSEFSDSRQGCQGSRLTVAPTLLARADKVIVRVICLGASVGPGHLAPDSHLDGRPSLPGQSGHGSGAPTTVTRIPASLDV